MTPTPEQVAQWALEERLDPGVYYTFRAEEITRLVTRAMAEQAEADAKLCETDFGGWNWEECAAAIRANAPKEPT